MSPIAIKRGAVSLEDCHTSDQDGCAGTVEDRFALFDAAGIGFFGVVFYALTKEDFTAEQSRLISDPVNYDSVESVQKIQAVKICSPLCPSGIKASARYLVKDIKAMIKIRSKMEEAVQHSFVRLYDYNTSNAPWYSMEPVLSGLTLEKLYQTSEERRLPVSEELAFHLVDQITKATLFLHQKCAMVRADVNRDNLMLRYPGRVNLVLPDVIMIDWSLWEEATAERIVKDTKDVFESVFPVLFQAGWECGKSHNEESCRANRHSSTWLELYRTMSAQQISLRCFEESITVTASECRRRVEIDDRKADAVRNLVLKAADPFVGTDLKKALSIRKGM
jgi:serine/threonine protein kinase